MLSNPSTRRREFRAQYAFFRWFMVFLLANCAIAVAPHQATAQNVNVNVTYSGSLGPVNSARPLCLCVYADAMLQIGVGCFISFGNPTSFSVRATDKRYLVAFVDLERNESVDPDEPYEIYNDRAAPPADGIQTGMANVDLQFGDENLPPPPTPSPSPTAIPTATATPTVEPCAGDCDGSDRVTIDELIRMVNIALGNLPLDVCSAGDSDANGSIEVNEIISGVNAASLGCML